ncbi:MAG: hypothetical protein ACYDEX_22545, partial [Mobilitalea sp.]
KSRYEVATIGNNVTISSGAKIIGKIEIGDGAIIGANAVVTKDIPNNAIAAGIPAIILSYIENPILINISNEEK